MSFLARIAREPMVHFMVIGAAIFVLSARFGGDQQATPRDRIVVTDGRVQQLAKIFAKTWQRPPTAQELRGLVDAHIKEEVYYREALRIGLDRDDTLIRRRMQQKMEFMTEPSEDALAATDAELEAFLAAHRAEFRVEPKLAFEQIFINPQRSEQPAAARVEKFLTEVSAAPYDADPRSLGDPTLLPRAMPLAPVSGIDRNFGQGFGAQLAQLPLNAWSGPVKSPYGLHLLRVTERHDGYDPPLADVRAAVERKWRDDNRDAFRKAEYERLRNKYEIVLPDGLGGNQAAKAAQ
jgi:PPIC-type PPIASE domain